MIRRLIYCVVIFIAAAAAIVFGRAAFIDAPRAGAAISFTVPEGANVNRVAALLAEKQLVKSAAWYRIYGWLDADARRPKVGTYDLQPGSSLHTIARAIALGPMRKEREAQVIEGWTVDDESLYLHAQFQVKPEVIEHLIGRAADRAPFEITLRDEFPFLQSLPHTRSLEGYLFPDTYRIWEDQLPEGLIRKQLTEFGTRFGATVVSAKIAPLKSLDEVVILASIIEKEVRSAEDRKIVAGIFLNRMKVGMALQSDATLTYITGSSRARSTAAELALNTPYNTYKYPGLPPSPICNPAASAIEAVLDSTPSNYRYFLTDPAGKVYYAATLEEHVQNKRKAGY